jgi:VWFA-related protein
MRSYSEAALKSMVRKFLSKSHFPGWPLPALLALCVCAPLFGQTTAPQTEATPAAKQYDPTKPETQPNLTLDHDPVWSPDARDNMPFHPPSAKSGTGQAIQQGRNGIYTLEENVDEVLLNVTVVDDKGNLVKGLPKEDFHVWEDGVPQTIASFQQQDLPVSMGILVDNSGSMRDKRSAVDAAALDLMRASNPDDAAFVVNFSDRAYLDQGFTSNVSLLERGLSRWDSKGTTAIYDAVAASADELSKYGKQPKQVLLIITDGADNASRLTLQQVVRRVQDLGGPVVYSIGLLYDDEPEEAGRAREALDTLSSDTGGLSFFPSSLSDVRSIAKEVAEDIRNQYTVGYHSTKSPTLGGYRTVHVEVHAPGYGKLIVRTKKGYYPRPARPTQTAQANPRGTTQ